MKNEYKNWDTSIIVYMTVILSRIFDDSEVYIGVNMDSIKVNIYLYVILV